MNEQEICEVLDNIRYKNWQCRLTGSGAIYWLWLAPCVDSGEMKVQSGRLWHLQSDLTEESLIRTAFAAAKMAEEHECAENFNYKGRRVFDPHKAVL